MYYLRTQFLRFLPSGDGTDILRARRRSSYLQDLKGSAFISQFLLRPAPGIEPATYRSGVKCSTDGANPAVKETFGCISEIIKSRSARHCQSNGISEDLWQPAIFRYFTTALIYKTQFRKNRFRRGWHSARVKRGDRIRDIKIILKLSEIVYVPSKGIQDSPGIWISRQGFRYQGTGFRISRAKNCRIPLHEAISLVMRMNRSSTQSIPAMHGDCGVS